MASTSANQRDERKDNSKVSATADMMEDSTADWKDSMTAASMVAN